VKYLERTVYGFIVYDLFALVHVEGNKQWVAFFWFFAKGLGGSPAPSPLFSVVACGFAWDARRVLFCVVFSCSHLIPFACCLFGVHIY